MLFVHQKQGVTASGRPYLYFLKRDKRFGHHGYTGIPTKARSTLLPRRQASDLKPVFILLALWSAFDVWTATVEWRREAKLDAQTLDLTIHSQV